MNDYIPISCSYYDELEAISTLKEMVVIEYFNDDNKPTTVAGRIVNLYTKQKQEFVELSNGNIIRLDKLIAVNGKVSKGYC